MVQNYIGINGIVTQDLNSITAELINDFKGIYGDNVNLESNTADGQWLNILAQQKIDALDFQVQLYNNIDVDSVVGLPQQVLYKLNGLTIKDYTYSWVYINVTVSQNVTLSGLDSDIANIDGSGYTVSDINGNNWILAESISLVASETPYLLLFRAQELGQITALANTITTMSTIVAGVVNVNNPANNFITGQTGETAAEFRTRRNRSLQAPSQGFKESIEGQLLALNDVSDAKVYDNKDDVSINGVQVIVQGGTSEEIGNIIYNNLPPGINTQGANEAIITVNNRDKVLNYDKPNPIPILVKGTIESLTDSINDVDLDYVKQTLASKQFRIGELAESANITTELKNILGETGSPYNIEISNSTVGGEWEVGGNIGFSYNDIIYVNGTYICCGNNGLVATSTDLTTWNQQTVSQGSSDKWNRILYLNNKYILLGNNSYIAMSSNLTDWTIERVMDEGGNYRFSNWIGAVFDGTYLFAISDIGYLTQYKNSSWNNVLFQITFPNESRTVTFYDISYVVNPENSALKYFITTAYAGSTRYVALSISADNQNAWTTSTYSGGVVTKFKVLNNKVIGVGSLCEISLGTQQISASNIIWNFKNVNAINITYNNGIYCIVSANGVSALSSDFQNWTTSQVDTNSRRWVFNTTNGFIAVGSNTNYITYSFPLPDWKEILTPSGLADFFVMTVDGMDGLEVIA